MQNETLKLGVAALCSLLLCSTSSFGARGGFSMDKRDASEVLLDDERIEQAMLSASRKIVKSQAEYTLNVDRTKRLRPNLRIAGVVYFSGSARAKSAFDAHIVLNVNNNGAFIVNVVADKRYFNDRRLLAKIEALKCGDENSTFARYAILAAQRKVGAVLFDDVELQLPEPKCAFSIAASLYQGHRFIGLRRVVEVERQ